jgi:hypothetical protein
MTIDSQESLSKMRREREALDRVRAYMLVDPFYRDATTMTPREEAIAHLALRAYTHPRSTDDVIRRLRFTRALDAELEE